MAAYDKNLDTGYSVVYLYSLADRKTTAVTSTLNNSYSAVFDPDRRYLYFLSDRDYNEVLGNIDFEFANPKTTRVYVATLTADEPSPFPALSDEVKVKSEEPAAGQPAPESNKKNPKQPPAKKEEKEPETGEKTAQTETKEPPKVFRIDLDGIQNRIVALAVPPAVIRNLDASKEAIYYSTSPIQGLSGPIPGEERAIHAYDLKERKEQGRCWRAPIDSYFPATVRSYCTGPRTTVRWASSMQRSGKMKKMTPSRRGATQGRGRRTQA
jgi:tricorn protease